MILGKNKQAVNEKVKKSKKNAQMPIKIDPKLLELSQKPIFEESLKTFLAVILFILFLLLFGAVAWYFLTQFDAALVSGLTSTKVISSVFQ